jgi:hypothetical protein
MTNDPLSIIGLSQKSSPAHTSSLLIKRLMIATMLGMNPIISM